MAQIPYVPLIDNSSYTDKEVSKKTKTLRLQDLGMQSDSSGKLTISDPDKFISGLGLSDAYAERLMSQGIDFSDFDEFKQFIDTAADSGNTTKEPGFYEDIFSDEANLSSDASIQKSSAVRSDESDKAADKAFNIKPKAKAPAPAQAQANRPTLDNPDNGTSAFATNAYLQMPDYLPTPGSNTKMPNRQKQALITEANRRQRKEIQEQIAREKKAKTRSLEDDRLAAINDQYRDIFANSSKDRSVEDWDAMSRDQKVKLIRNYNINGGSKSMEKPEGEVTKTGTVGQAFEAPKPGLEDLTTPRQFNNETEKFEIPQTPRQFNNETEKFEIPGQEPERISRFQLPVYNQQVPPETAPEVAPVRIPIGPKTEAVTKKVAPEAPSLDFEPPQAPAPAAKLPSADPFVQDEPAEMQGPKEKMVPIYGRDGIVGYRSYSDQRKAAQDYAKRRMQESPRSLLGQTYSGDMEKLYPTLNTGDIKRDIDQENIARLSKNNPFGEEYRPKGKGYNPFA